MNLVWSLDEKISSTLPTRDARTTIREENIFQLHM